MKMPKFFLAALALGVSLGFWGGVSENAYADSAADVLFKSVPGTSETQAQAPTSGPINPALLAFSLGKDLKLTDPVLMQFFSLWQSETNLPYDVNAWALRVLKQETVDASHLWSAVTPKLPGSFEVTATTAHLYLLWKLGLSQTFFNQWVEQLASPRFLQSRMSAALEQTISPKFDQWLVDNGILVSPQQESTLKKIELNRSPVYVTLRAWMALRGGDEAAAILEKLPANHRLKLSLAQTVALARAKKRDLSGAAAVLKRHLEPAIEAAADPKLLSAHYLQVARLLYQAGSLDGAEQFYTKIPNGVPEYLPAREELVWVWLRKGNLTKLRGELVTLGSGLFDDRFAPEVYLVRAISNLKLCFYDKVEQDSKDFVRVNARFAKEITEALKAQDPPVPKDKDVFTRLAEKTAEKRQEEIAQLDVLGQQSVAASLPAVGWQSHWVRAKNQALADLETAKKNRTQEYRRQWANRAGFLKEAIHKMQFVKVEYLSQLRTLAKTGVPTSVSQMGLKLENQKELIKNEGADMSFPFDGVIWPDELFHLRSVAQARCLGGNP